MTTTNAKHNNVTTTIPVPYAYDATEVSAVRNTRDITGTLRFNPQIKEVNIIVPNKVVEVTFSDGTKEKSVCREPDVFSLETAISICISKKLLGGSSAYNRAIKKAIRVYNDGLKKRAAEKAEKERIEKKRAKRLAYKERKAARRREEQIAIQREAILQAMDIVRMGGKA